MRVHFVLMLSMALFSCSPEAPYADVRPFSVCMMAKYAPTIVEADIGGWGSPELFTQAIGYSHMSPIRLSVTATYKGTPGPSLSAYVRDPISESGESVVGPLAVGRRGVFFLHSAEGHTFVSYQQGYFWEDAETGLWRNDRVYLDGLTRSSLDEAVSTYAQADSAGVSCPEEAPLP